MPETATSAAASSTEQMTLEVFHDRTATHVTREFERLLFCDVESEWKNRHIV
jgi:hypothetical protein